MKTKTTARPPLRLSGQAPAARVIEEAEKDGAVLDALAAFTAALKGLPFDAREHIESAGNHLAATFAEAAWTDGFLCGRDPARLVFGPKED